MWGIALQYPLTGEPRFELGSPPPQGGILPGYTTPPYHEVGLGPIINHFVAW